MGNILGHFFLLGYKIISYHKLPYHMWNTLDVPLQSCLCHLILWRKILCPVVEMQAWMEWRCLLLLDSLRSQVSWCHPQIGAKVPKIVAQRPKIGNFSMDPTLWNTIANSIPEMRSSYNNDSILTFQCTVEVLLCNYLPPCETESVSPTSKDIILKICSYKYIHSEDYAQTSKLEAI